MNELRAFRQEIKEANCDFRRQLETYSEWIVDNGKKIEEVNKKVNALVKDVELLLQENTNLKKNIIELTDRVNNLEQTLRDKVVEIHGVPAKKGENLISVVEKMSTVINFNFDPTMIDNCYRYKIATGEAGRSGGIVVKFTRKMDMLEFLAKRRQKRNLNSRDLGFMDGEVTPMYVNESLTPAKRKLLNAARVIKKEKQFTFLWVKNGRIFMRKTEGERFVIIDSEKELGKLE
ncbi:uncharacterized protein LOC124368168 [Homalodisca vitripennis]|uniref:uncharacterized protein LOC124368168 n=1 Tax=Homalodisca vitripennis TaxID=197043 RepID=UPI001EE9EB3D|nr:uncharacterized protein LOC124368168 [Homalodisca vitripennis]